MKSTTATRTRYSITLYAAFGLGVASTVLGGTPQISIGSNSGAPGGIATLPTNLSANSAGVALQFDVTFDGTILNVGIATPANTLPKYTVAFGQPTNGVLRVVIYSLGNVLLNNGVLVNLPFSISPSAVDGPISIGLMNVIMVDATAAIVQPVALQSGVLTVSIGAGAHLGLLVRSISGQVQFQLTGTPDKNYVVQASTDLVRWTDLSTNVVIGGNVTITDPGAASLLQRFYRAKFAP